MKLNNAETVLNRTRAWHVSYAGWLALILLIALFLRLAFVGTQGFSTDTNDFANWALALATHPFGTFYKSTSFADYPPGYLYVLWAVAKVYALGAPHGNPELLKGLVKAPAILMDLADAAILYALVRRIADDRWAIIVSAAYALNPAIIFISAVWGQVDSVALGFALVGCYVLLRPTASERRAWGNVAASWAALSCSVLIKPQAAFLAPLFLVFILCGQGNWRRRSAMAACGIVSAIAVAIALAFPFHSSRNPFQVLTWLYHVYEVGKNVYPYNSVNAFNLWAVVHRFWQSDAQLIGFLPQYAWGMLLVGVAAILVLVRYSQQRTERAFIEAAALIGLAFFMFSTRMHERYAYDGLVFALCAMPVARRYAGSSAILSATLFLNLLYSLRYLDVVTHGVAGVNQADMWGFADHALSLLNVGVFFWLGYRYLGDPSDELDSADAWKQLIARKGQAAQSWFDPREGTVGFVWPLDYLVSGALAVSSFLMLYARFWFPPEKIFDEVYFARAAEEYLHRQYIYENTHPPITKLLITLSTLMFGDNTFGWRFLDVVFGAVAIWLLYALLKRVTGSTLFSAYGAGLFMLDGMHFVQSRIATPESFVVVFALAALYTFYRYWLASQVRIDRVIRDGLPRVRATGAATCVCAATIFAVLRFGHESASAKFVAGICVFAGLYLIYRFFIERHIGKTRTVASYPDGTTVALSEEGATVRTPDGGVIAPRVLRPGDLSVSRSGRLELRYDTLRITYSKNGQASYVYPDGSETFVPSPATNTWPGLWLALFAVSIALLVASKWYGVMACGVALTIVLTVWIQPRLASLRHRYGGAPRRPMVWGNPNGFRLDVTLAAVTFIVGAMYFAAYTPQYIGLSDSPGAPTRAYTLTDIVKMQYDAFEYHDKLVATHPYESKWWQWPLDLRPILYYARYGGHGSTSTAAMIYTLPNPLIFWLGLLTVPLVGYLGFRERNKAYTLIALTYVAQWLPWMGSPRISFAYHFYVDVPLICACNAIAMQRLWRSWRSEHASPAKWLIGGYFAAVAFTFAYFYPILSGMTIPAGWWMQRMWLHSWI